MTVTVASGFSPKGRLEYGETFLRTFRAHWPAEVRLACYVEATDAALEALAPGALRSLWDCPGAQEFIDEFAMNPLAKGRRYVPGMNWKPKCHRLGYSWRYDAWKFSRQCMIPLQASLDLPDGDILVWLDGDVVTFKDVPTSFVEGLIGTADGCYLGRGAKHSEIGFWAVRLGPKTRAFLQALADAYTKRTVFQLKEYHSAFAWDHYRRIAETDGARFLDLTPGGHDHIWTTSPLAAFSDHLKGSRKAMGFSPELKRPA
jgi:hypothetical protein